MQNANSTNANGSAFTRRDFVKLAGISAAGVAAVFGLAQIPGLAGVDTSKAKHLNVYIDQTGTQATPYYVLPIVLHDTSQSAEASLSVLESDLSKINFAQHNLNAGALIRNEGYYKGFSMRERRSVLNSFSAFTAQAPINTQSFVYKCTETGSQSDLNETLISDITAFAQESASYFAQFDTITVIYGTKQYHLGELVSASLQNALGQEVGFAAVSSHEDSRLSQTANFVGAHEYLDIKHANGRSSKATRVFFGNKLGYLQGNLEIIRSRELV